ncbi:hypothetical protein, partial [Azospirillum sp. B4]
FALSLSAIDADPTMKKLLLILIALVVLGGAGAALVVAATTSPAPSAPTERVISNDRFPQ